MRKLTVIRRDLRTMYTNIAGIRAMRPCPLKNSVLKSMEREVLLVQLELDLLYMLRK